MQLLRNEVAAAPSQELDFLGRSPAIVALVERAKRVAQNSDDPILITGAIGVGKSHLARLVHRASGRAACPCVIVDCGAIPAELDNILFGHRAGSFTGAARDFGGRLREANGGTLVLEDFDRLSLHHQDQLHRVLENGRFYPLGSTREVAVDVRFVGTTNKDVPREVEAGRLKADFVSRLDYLPLHVPSLHNRPEDIPLLAEALLARQLEAQRAKRIRDDRPLAFDADCAPALQARRFDDNVRGLDKLVARLIVEVGERPFITPADIERVAPALGGDTSYSFDRPKPLRMVRDAAEERYILDVCRHADWNLRRAARILNISPKSLYAKFKQYGIGRPG